ncbi:penicillin-binding protein activator [Marinobacter sp. CHS3-4]|uniref:penicillin-binding protein activator n=1 Tax=Marinobacter sp. CHS3-4 TaxID=3045174 RepID=UPI0024B48451|nr:penicillin-binding protein activator [Marinobacter sp. CHS3-4]MDI9246274.1 penicillin-binding protein activator [Marinobacter sp. CHS3-4]
MTIDRSQPVHCRLSAAVVALVLLVSGCASVNLNSFSAPTSQEALSAAAGESDRALATDYLLREADRFVARKQPAAARTILQSDQLSGLTGKNLQEQQLLSMEAAVALEDSDWSQQIASDIKPAQFLNYSRSQLSRVADLQVNVYQLANLRLQAAMTLILLAESDTSADVQSLHDRIWENLRQTPDGALARETGTAIGYESQGWLELASVLRDSELTVEEQGRAIRRWQSNWPGHPAVETLPEDLRLIANLADSRPEKIALALPLSGPLASAGAAIRDGFFAAYFEDSANDPSKVSIQVVDTSDRRFDDLYRELVAEDYDLIVGPLEKDALSTLAKTDSLPVSVLGLNYLPEGVSAPSGLYQYGLSAEDEARQIADRMIDKEVKQILALIPMGNWGDRLEKALLKRLTDQGGLALNIERYFREDNLRAVTADLLGVTVSRERAIDVERTAGIDVEFEPRRRQDADGIVMVAEPTIARQFKPLFAFYFGGDLPVYSPSMVYEGNPDPSRDRDLNGVTFTDTPWTLGEENDFRQTAQQAMPEVGGQIGRLFAMGADAWTLSNRLSLLRYMNDAFVDGQTGRLTMDTQGSVHREQLWARFENGTPNLLASEPRPGTPADEAVNIEELLETRSD